MSANHPHIAALLVATVAAGIIVARLPAQTAPGDNPPTITLNAQATTPTTWRPGGQGTFSWSVTDDQSLQSVTITSSLMNYQRITINDTGNCSGKTFCEWTEYVFVPSSPGQQFVTVTATDSAGQVSTKTMNFDALGCTTDADCGSGIQWSGTAFCGSTASDGLETDIMQNGVAAACKSGGICDTSSQRHVKQLCGAGRVCTFDSRQSDGAVCVVDQPECALGMRITSLCRCENSTLNYPLDYRVATPAYCCSSANGGTTLQNSPCVSASTCTLTLGGNKSTYVIGEGASFSVACATPSFVTMQLVDPNGTASFIGQISDVRVSNAMGFSTERYAIGNHSLRICVNDGTCQPASIVTAPFTVVAKTASPVPSTPATATSALLPAANLMPSGFLDAPVMTYPSALPMQVVGEKSQVIAPKATARGHVQNVAVEGKRTNAADIRRETQLLKNRGKQTSAKIKSIGKSIASLEEKIDAKLRLLDRAKRKEVHKRVTAQIDGWQKKIDGLGAQKEKLEILMDDLLETWEQMKAAAQ